MVRLLLQFNADPEMKDHRNRRPLHRYAHRGNIEAMRAIPLPVRRFHAKFSGRKFGGEDQQLPDLGIIFCMKTARWMLQRGVEVNPYSTDTSVLGLRTPLHEAVRYGVDTVSILLEFGADAERKDKQLNMPLHHAAKVGKTEAARLLMERWPEGIREKNDDLNTPLRLVGARGGIKVVKLLFECSPEGIGEKNKNLDTPRHLAGAMRNSEVLGFVVTLTGRPEDEE
jgi:ankyrin repeat protein